MVESSHGTGVTRKKEELGRLRDRSLFMIGGSPEENRFFWEKFSWLTQHKDKKFRGPLDIAQ